MISKYLLILVTVLSVLTIYSNINPVLADYCIQDQPFGQCSCNPGACPPGGGTQTAHGTDNITGVDCVVSASCNIPTNTNSCSCGAPNHNLVSCDPGSTCRGLLGDGCGFCETVIGPTSTPAPLPTGAPTSTPAPLPTIAPSPGHIQCSFIVNGQRTNPNTFAEYPAGSNIRMDVMNQVKNSGCWSYPTFNASIYQLAPGQGCALNVGTATQYACSAGAFTANCNPATQNCLFADTGTGRDRYCDVNNGPSDPFTLATPAPGNYCVHYHYGGHGDVNCNDTAAEAFCEFVIDPPIPVVPAGTLSCSPTNVYLGSSGTGNASVTGTYSNVEPGHQAQLCVGSASGPSAPLMQRASSGNGTVGSANNVNFITVGFNTFYLHDAPDGNAANNCSGPVLASCAVNGIQPSGTITCNPTVVVPGNKSSVKANYNNLAPGHTAQICQTITNGTVGLATQENPHSGGTGPLDATANASTLNSPTDIYKYNLYDNPTAGDTITNGCQGTVLASCTVTAQPPASGGNTCAITGVGELKTSSILPELSISYTGTSSNTTNLWVSRKDGGRVNTSDIGSTGIYPPTEKTDSFGNYYYKVASCPPGTPGGCGSEIVGVPGDFGQYYVFCDNVDATIPGAPFCSGNPHCSYKNNSSSSVDCGSNIYACSSNPNSPPDNIAPISGFFYNYDGSVQKGVTMNKDASSSICAADQPAFGSTDDNGFYIIDDKPVEQTFCLRPDASQYTSSSPYLKPSAINQEYINLVGPNLPNYECQWPGGKHTGFPCDATTYDLWDIKSDYGLNFQVQNQQLSVDCGLTGDTTVNGQVTWTANTPSGGSGNYTYTWASVPQPGGPPPLTPTPAPGPLAGVWKTSYGATGPVGAQVTIKDNTGSFTSPTCTSNITPPSNLDVNGDVHSNL